MSMRRPFSLDRRTLLRGTAGAALSLPLLEAMFEKRVYPQVADAPKRFIFAYAAFRRAEKRSTKHRQATAIRAPRRAGALTAALKVGLEPLEMLGLKGDTRSFRLCGFPERLGQRSPLRQLGFHYETMGPHGLRRFGAQRQFLASGARPIVRLAPRASNRLGHAFPFARLHRAIGRAHERLHGRLHLV